MAHYAFLDSNNTVIQVIVGRDENEMNTNWELYYTQIAGHVAKRTSYNTRGGIYYSSQTNEPHEDQSKAFRKNYAGLGFTYDYEMDAFIPPKPNFELLEYQIESNSATWIVSNVSTSNIVNYVNNTYAYIINSNTSAILSGYDEYYYFITSIDTQLVLDYVNNINSNT